MLGLDSAGKVRVSLLWDAIVTDGRIDNHPVPAAGTHSPYS
jgi:hypothetical protein